MTRLPTWSRTLMAAVFTLIYSGAFPQRQTQTIKGIVVDKDTKAPLPGANIIVHNTDPILGASADGNGRFVIENIPVGRQTVQVSFLGYEQVIVPNITVGSGKEVVLRIELQESVITSEVIVIKANREKDRAINTMATVSAKTFSMEETQRYAGGFNDISRMTESFAGVSSFTGETNEIVIRGNSPRGLLWRVEGIEIANPNHFPRGNGSSGGGMSIITSDVISNSDFFTGAFPAEYGNALSGVFDINLRNGNCGKREYAVQLGVIGVEATAEGPFGRKTQSSYLVNYRYSTLKLFDLAGIHLVDESVIPEFQDLTFNLNFPAGKAGTFTLFGLGGMSSAGEKEERDSALWEFPGDRIEEYELHKMGAAGLKHFYPFKNRKTYFKTVVLGDAEYNTANADSIDNGYDTHRMYGELFRYSTLRASFLLNHKFNTRHSLRAGFIYSLMDFNMFTESLNPLTGELSRMLENDGTTSMLQGYAQWKIRFGPKLELNTGFHYLYFALNGNSSPEPRAGLRWQFSGTQALTLGTGLHSRVEAISFYFTELPDQNGNVCRPNEDLDLTKAWHAVAGHDFLIRENLHLRTEAYYQFLFDVPVENGTSGFYSTINYRGGLNQYALNNTGEGINYGLEITLEKYFSKNYYFLFTSSLFDSKYKAPNGNIYNTFYNNNFIFNMVGGKEFRVGKNGNNIVGTNFKFLWKGGNRMIPVDAEKSVEYGREMYDLTSIYEQRVPDFIRMDVGFSYRINLSGYSLVFSVDFQNIFNRKNVFTYRYDADREKVVPVCALPFIPVINCRMEF
ncbi:MAG: TonB-dependent receptor [Bacteroidetes bacterium]|nr:TonB-dependent receptor [Bacteroidota bacterium]